MKNRNQYNTVLFCLIFAFISSCSSDDTSDDLDATNTTEENLIEDAEPNEEEESTSDTGENDDATETDNSSPCNAENSVYNEAEGLVMVEFESGQFSDDWELKTQGDNYTGDGYMVWTGDQFLGSPGNGTVTFKLNITTPGTYRFEWRSSVTTGDQGTEHNDSWLRFADADDFFGEKNDSRVYPKDTGKTPNPNGSSKDGWFKIYRSGNDLDFKWNTSTSDNDAHKIYVTFNTAKIYTMEVSARSSGHAIDKFALFSSSWTMNEATADSIESSVVTCN
ncbi:hypothetical protein [Maribacter litoralis]|uniref:hypothetical protein n=1 Tax=Maribacter litoralis TaxID=2059726 RepID=UPI000E321E56|nr:hypothetical protein [Maribacter litoralis]